MFSAIPDRKTERNIRRLNVLGERYDLGDPSGGRAYAQLRSQAAIDGNSEVVAECDYFSGVLHHSAGRFDVARGHLESALSEFSRLADADGLARCEIVLARNYWSQSNFAAAVDAAGRARERWSDLEDPVLVADCDLHLSIFHRTHGSLAQSEVFALAARDMLMGEQSGSAARYVGRDLDHRLANCDVNLGLTLWMGARYGEARTLFERARASYEAIGYRQGVADCDLNRGQLEAECRDFAAARVHLEAALDMMEKARVGRHRIASLRMTLGAVCLGEDDPATAMRLLRQARSTLRRLRIPQGVAECDHRLATVERHLGRSAAAVDLFTRAYEAFVTLQLPRQAAEAAWDCGRTIAQAPGSGRDDEAVLDWWVPAFLTVTVMGAEFPNPHSRRLWQERVDIWASELFRFATGGQRSDLVADLVDVELNRLVYATERSPGVARDGSYLEGDARPLHEGAASPRDPADELSALTMAASQVQASGDLPTRAAPTVMRAYGRVALGKYRDALERAYGITQPGTLGSW